MKAKTKFTRLWSILLALVMVVGMLPTTALAAETATADFTSGDGSAALALLNAAKTEGAANSVWDSTTNTLTLNGVNFETTAVIALKLPAGAKIVLKGVNTINGGNSGVGSCCGIYGAGDLTIQGTGTLNVTGAAADSSYGIRVEDNLTITDSTVTAKGGTAGYVSYGICADKNVIIKSGTVTAKGGTATNVGSYGIYAYTGVNIAGGTVKATGGTASGSDALSSGIFAYSGKVTISGTADVTAIGGTATDNSYGIAACDNIEISGGTVTAYGGEATKESYGIYSYNGNVTISDDADVTAKGGTATNGNSYGIYANTGLTISGDNTVVTATGGEAMARKSKGIFVNSNSVTILSGKVEATGGKAGVESYGIEARDDIEISGGTVTAKGGEVTKGVFTYSFGIYSNNKVTISNTATVTAEGGKTTNSSDTYSHGIHASDGLSISGGTVTAQAGTAMSARAFEKSPSISISPNYWWRTSESGTYKQYPDSAYTWITAHTYVEIRNTDPAAATTYTVTVTNGTASVSKAAAGTTVTLNADAAPTDQVFDKWVVESGSASITLADETNANTTFTMPAGDVSVKATYKAASHTHSYGSEWKSDANKHWHECSCSAKSEEAAHTASNWITDTAATATTVGTKHKECTTCGYVMETGTIPATGSVTAPKITKGYGATVTHGEKTALSFRSNADFSGFIRVEIDGKTLDAKNYTVKEGSTIVTLNADYVSTLSVGKHTIGIVSNNGTATATFTVEAKQTTGNEHNPNTGARDDVPQTGDNSMMALRIAVLFVSGFGVVTTAVYGKKRKSVK